MGKFPNLVVDVVVMITAVIIASIYQIRGFIVTGCCGNILPLRLMWLNGLNFMKVPTKPDTTCPSINQPTSGPI